MPQQQKYRVLEKLEAGGMAEVFRGEAESLQGFKKLIAIKRVLPHLAQNKKFIAMFLDEARLSLHLSHANIVQVFDIGWGDDTYFIVMEFVDGASLKAIIENLRKRGELMPVEQAVYLTTEVCRGLAYAHELSDHEGHALRIVHRDVSPPNVLISKRGEIKLVDFGLAKAASQVEKTDPGVVKGKFSYLSPEAANGEDVDQRADIFAAGILLWELLSGRRLFLGETDYQTVQLVRAANIPSIAKLNPACPRDLETVLNTALARDPAERYQAARDFGDDLMKVLFAHGLKVSAYDIANLVTSVVSEQQAVRRVKEPSIIDRLISEELLRFTSIDEIEDPLNPGAKPLSPEEISGSTRLEPVGFEDPRSWGGDGAAAGAAMPGRVATPSRRPPASGAPVGGLERLLEPEGGGHSSLADALESRRGAPPTPAVSEEASGGALQVLLIITLVLLVGTGAAVLLVPGGLDFLRSILR